MTNWNVVNARLLRETLGDITDRDEVLVIIRAWWRAAEQEQSRKCDMSVALATVATMDLAASFEGEMLEWVIERAATSPQAWKGLRRWARAEAEQGRKTAPNVALVLFSDCPKGRRPTGQTLARFARDNQLAAIVGALQDTPFGSLGTAGGSFENAFALAAEATLQPFEIIRHAWQAHKAIFGANN